MHAARVLRDVAADRARDLARRIGRVIQAERRDDIRDRRVAYARLNHGDARDRIDAYDTHELRHRQQHAVAERQRAARKARARAARHDRDVHRVAGLQHALHLLLAMGQRHDHRHVPVRGEPVALVRPGLFLAPQDFFFGKEFAQRRDDRALPVQVHLHHR